MKIPGILALLFLASSPCLAQVPATQPCSETWHDFLAATEGMVVKKETLATLHGTRPRDHRPAEKAKAVFTAIVARDPAHPGSVNGGIEVQFSFLSPQGNSSHTVYLDRALLPDFLRSLDQEILDRQHPSRYSPDGRSAIGSMTPTGIDAAAHFPCYPVMDAGWHTSNAGIGLWLEDRRDNRPPLYPIAYIFPGVSLEQFEQVIRAAQAYIAANTPRPQP